MGITSIPNFVELEKEMFDIKNIKTNKLIKVIILNKIKLKNYNFFKLTIFFKDKINDEFIINSDINLDINTKIKILTYDLKTKVIDGIYYFEILKFFLVGNAKIKKTEPPKFKFNFPKFIQTSLDLDYLEENSIISILAKAHEKENIFSNLNSNSNYIFKDIDELKININYQNDKIKIEGQKIYFFQNFIYNNKTLNQSDNSIISEINETLNEKLCIEYTSIKDVIHFRGIVDSLNIKFKYIYVRIKDINNKVKVYLNYNLMRKLNMNCECQFLFFSKVGIEFKYTNFSDILFEEKTYIELYFIDYNTKYYNRIKVDDNIININSESIKFEINTKKQEKSLTTKKLIYEKINEENKIESFLQFILEVNIGKVNKFNSLLTKNGGYAYQIYYEVTKENFLPKNFQITYENNNIINLTPEDGGNKFRERFTIINIPNNNISEIEKNENIIFPLKSNSNNEIKSNSYKYLISHNENEIKAYKFILKEMKEMIEFKIDNRLEKILENFYNDCFHKNCELLYKELFIAGYSRNQIYNLISDKNIEDIIYKYIKEGFSVYKFKNNQKDYNLIKYICFLIISKMALSLEYDDFSKINNNFKKILDKMDMEYIDRIKALIAITGEFIAYKKEPVNQLEIITIEDQITENNFYFINSMEKLLLIIDGLTEESGFFGLIHQINSIILEDEFSNKSMYTSSILNINDIRLDLIKHVGKFCIIKSNDKSCFGYICPSSKTIFINPNSFFGKYTNNKVEIDKQNQKRLTSATLFILFKEMTGYFNNNINRTNSKDVNFENNKIMKFFSENNIEINNFINSKESEGLLDENLYIDVDLNNLRKKLKKIKDEIYPIHNDNNIV